MSTSQRIYRTLAGIALTLSAALWLSNPASAGTAANLAAARGARTAKSSITLEGLGNAGIYSLNYERLVHDDVGLRAGFSYLFLKGFDPRAGSISANVVIFPLSVNYLGVSSGSHSLELGLGATLLYATGDVSAHGIRSSESGLLGFGTVMVGYRYQPRDGGFQFRVGVAGLYGPGLSLTSSDPDRWGIAPNPYISFGATF